ncbi:MAG TPA: BACON domain-containing carbohydrate-binding protein [Bryobacteraceae bacterium]
MASLCAAPAARAACTTSSFSWSGNGGYYGQGSGPWSFESPGGSLSISVTGVGAGCTYSVTVPAPSSGSVSGTTSGSTINASLSIAGNGGSNLRVDYITVTVNGVADTRAVYVNGANCTVSFSPSSTSVGAAGISNASVTLVRGGSPPCWYIDFPLPPSWIHASNDGNGNFTYSVDPNTGAQRMGNIYIDIPATTTFQITQAAAICTFSVSPTTAQSVAYTGGSTQFTITASPSGCSGGSWAASVSTPAWMSISPSGGSAGGTATATYQANSVTNTRSGTVTIAGQNITINQAAAPATCTFSAAPSTTQSISAAGGSTLFTITASPSGCSGGSWTASVSDPTWMSVSPAGGSAAGSATATYQANSTASQRSGTVTIAGQSVTINEAPSAPSTCSFSATPASVPSIAAVGGTTLFTVTASPSGCSGGSWTASVSDQTWMSVLPTSGTGPATVTATYQVNANPGTRNGTITIAGQSISVGQVGAAASACTFTINPTPAQTVTAAGGSTVFAVLANPSGCSGGSWSASVSDSTWMSLSSTSGTAAASVTTTYGANSSSTGRSGTVTIAGTGVTINQNGKTASPPAIVPGTLPNGVVGSAYSANLSANGGTQPYNTWAFSGSFPPGLSLNSSSGAISGSPSTATGSPFAFTVTVKDNTGAISAPQSFSITVTTPQTLSITTSSIPAGLANVVYQTTAFTVKGGTPPYQWSSTGALSGSMSFSTGGVLSGTPSATGSFPFSVTVMDSSSPALTASGNFTLNVTQPGTLLSVTPQQLSFSYVQGDSNTPPSQNIGILSNPSGTPVSASSSTSDGGTWLTAATNFSAGGKTPGTIVVSVDPSKLGPSTYSGQVTINAPSASPSSVTVGITLTVGATQAPQLSVTPLFQSFALPQGGQAQGTVLVTNTGGGVLGYSGAPSSDANWLSLNGSFAGNITPSTPGNIPFTVNAAANLPAGLHQGKISVFDLGSGKTIDSVIALLVSGNQPTMQLSQDGMTFYAVANSNVSPPAQPLGVLNLGPGTLAWNTQIQFSDPTHQGWLSVTPSGNSTSATPGQATASVNPAGLPKGKYYATVNVLSAASNSPQSMSVLLDVVGPGELGSAPQVSAAGLILAATVGSATAASQSVTLFSPAGANLNYSTSVFNSEGGNWLSVASPTGSLGATGSTSLKIQASAASVTAGVHFGTVQVAFSEGTVRTIQVILVATAGATPSAISGSGGATRDGGTCPSILIATFVSPGPSDSLQAGQAQTFQVHIADDCGNPLLPSQSATAELVDADTGAILDNLSSSTTDGIWTGAWTPPVGQATVNLRVFASRGKTFGGISTPFNSTQLAVLPVVSVKVLPADTNSAPQPVAAINGASFDVTNPGLVVPGGYVSIYGARMADSPQQAGASLATTLGNSQLLLGGKSLPLLYADSGQVNGLIPLSVPLYSHIQLSVQRDNTVSVPVSVYVTDLQPGIFTTARNGQGQGSILIHGTSLVAGPTGPQQQPVSRGQYIEIYATGLGQVYDPKGGASPPGDGQPAPALGPIFYTKGTANVTIGGVNTGPVAFAGLAPGFVALYQVNVLVPPNAPVGGAIPVVLTVTDSSGTTVSSQSVTIAVQ